MSTNFARRAGIWTATFATVLTLGMLVGKCLDQMLFVISRDYVYAPGRFERSAADFALVCGTILAAAAAMGPRPPARLARIAVLAILGTAVITVLSLGVATLRGLAVKLGWSIPPHPTLIPYARFLFSEGLWQGAFVGSSGFACWAFYRLTISRAPILVRPAKPEDLPQQIALFRNTIRHINSRDYSDAQVRAWAPDEIDSASWTQRLADHWCFVAEHNSHLVGYCNGEANGHLDHFFVHAAHQRSGVGRTLLAAVESHFWQLGVKRIFTESSITARPFFEHAGFQLIAEQTVTCRGEEMVNFRMEKILSAA